LRSASSTGAAKISTSYVEQQRSRAMPEGIGRHPWSLTQIAELLDRIPAYRSSGESSKTEQISGPNFVSAGSPRLGAKASPASRHS
jgi:hypothetical protein